MRRFARAQVRAARAVDARFVSRESWVAVTARRVLTGGAKHVASISRELSMNRIGIVLALVIASVGSVGCAASSADGQEEETGQSEEKLQAQTRQGLSCHRFPTDTCISVGTYCRNHGGELWCDLYGNCTCIYPVLAQ
jgi:hypothetical protein